MYYLITHIALFFLIQNTLAAEKILCSHPQICNLITLITPKENLTTEVVFIGDHHHYEPSANVVKNFIQAPILITGPKALHPWLSPILKNRRDNHITISSAIDVKFTELYKTKNQEALAHFWLYPDIACDILMQYQNKFRKNKIPHNEITEEKCLEHFHASLDLVKKAAKNIKFNIVLTHDALLPLFGQLNLKVHSLKGSGHHEEISPKAVKSLYLETKNNPVIWIQEAGFEVPMAIKRLIKKNDYILHLDPNGKAGENVTDALEQIGIKMISIGQKVK